jgi:hypothetical protein
MLYRLDKYTNPDSHKKQTPGMMSTIGRAQNQQSKEYKPQKRAPSCIGQRHLYMGRLALFRTQLTNVLARHNSKGATAYNGTRHEYGSQLLQPTPKSLDAILIGPLYTSNDGLLFQL